ncbi:MAG: ABC transporter ATP-binding protein, partial [Candidatus Bathyarchaeia archaeon]
MQHKDFKNILQEGEKFLACFESDLTKSGMFGRSFLIITDRRVVTTDANLMVEKSVNLMDISSVKIEDYVGNAELKIVLKDSSTTSIIRFSRSLRKKFGDAVKLIENLTLLRGVEQEELSEEKEEKPKLKTGPILYILKFVTPYKFLLTMGILTGIASIFLGLLPPYFMRMLIDDVILGHKKELLSQVIIAIILTQVVSTILGIIRSYSLSYVSLKAMYDIRVKMFNHIMNFQPSILDTYEAGRLISRITDDVGRVNWFLSWGLEQLLRSIVSLASVAMMILILEPRLSLIALIPLPILGLGVFLFNKKSTWVYHYEWRRWADVSALLVDVIPGFSTVKSHVMEKTEEEKLKLKLRDVIVAGLRSTKLNLQFFPMLGLVMSVGTAVIWWIGGYEVLGGTLTLGTLSAFISYVSQFYGPVWNLVSMVEPMKRASTAAERIQSIMNMEPKIRDEVDCKDLKIKGSVVFDNVSFGYLPYMYVLKNVSFEIKPGEKIGIVGPTGGGKTTIVKLLMRFYDVDEGRILIDGVDIKKIRLESLRRQIGIVSQEPRLF